MSDEPEISLSARVTRARRRTSGGGSADDGRHKQRDGGGENGHFFPERVMSEKVCKILLRPSPQAWGTPSLRGICDVDFCRFT